MKTTKEPTTNCHYCGNELPEKPFQVCGLCRRRTPRDLSGGHPPRTILQGPIEPKIQRQFRPLHTYVYVHRMTNTGWIMIHSGIVVDETSTHLRVLPLPKAGTSLARLCHLDWFPKESKNVRVEVRHHRTLPIQRVY
jgi:hypothetical protein